MAATNFTHVLTQQRLPQLLLHGPSSTNASSVLHPHAVFFAGVVQLLVLGLRCAVLLPHTFFSQVLQMSCWNHVTSCSLLADAQYLCSAPAASAAPAAYAAGTAVTCTVLPTAAVAVPASALLPEAGVEGGCGRLRVHGKVPQLPSLHYVAVVASDAAY